jgi:hypothetical protein
MVKVIVVVRKPAKLKPDRSLEFELPEVPSIGGYISIHGPDKTQPFGEDVVVHRITWRLEHPETRTGHHAEDAKVGSVAEIIVECDTAPGPYANC